MYQILKPKQIVLAESSHAAVEVVDCFGGGTQGEVYKVYIDGKPLALKWYFPHYLQIDHRLRERLEMAIRLGPPTNKFLWPIDLASVQGVRGFGYLMPIREPRFKGIADWMFRKIEPSFRTLVTAAFEAASSYRKLHSDGLCYRDISLTNIFFDPDTGDVRISDNDNVDFDGIPGAINGTPRFMAPEIVRGEAVPSRLTDLFSLAVLFFYLLLIHHPLEGKKEDSIHALDPIAMKKLYGSNPIFIFDPLDESNRPVSGRQDNPICLWPIYPQFLRDLFIQSFTVGIQDPKGGRVQEGQWQNAMIRLRDSIYYCAYCQAENFYDISEKNGSHNNFGHCWNCKKETPFPPRIRIGNTMVMLNYDSKLFPHHVNSASLYDFSGSVAEVNQHPSKANICGLKNVSLEKWVATLSDGKLREVEPGKSITLSGGVKINFGATTGEVEVD